MSACEEDHMLLKDDVQSRLTAQRLQALAALTGDTHTHITHTNQIHTCTHTQIRHTYSDQTHTHIYIHIHTYTYIHYVNKGKHKVHIRPQRSECGAVNSSQPILGFSNLALGFLL